MQNGFSHKIICLFCTATWLRIAGALLVLVSSTFAQDSSPSKSKLYVAATAVADRVLREGPPNDERYPYHRELTLEGLLEWSAVTGDPKYQDYVLKMLADRGVHPTTEVSWRQQPFGCLTYETSRFTGNQDWLPVFIRQSRLLRTEVERSPEGGILHPRGAKRGGGQALLIDALGEYIARMAQAGELTDEPEFRREVAEQLRIYAEIVRDPKTGLWSQGRGWLAAEPQKLSPGFWSRGHGWLIRGMERSLRSLPPDSDEFQQVQQHFVNLSDALLIRQTESGLWHCLLTRSPEESPYETSGSAMIASHLARGWKAGILKDAKYREAAMRTFEALPEMVTAEGVVLSVSPGPGPLESEVPWLRSSFPPNDPHGAFTILSAATAEHQLSSGAHALPERTP
ncbi:glycoside hydrolase family 88 protein [Planctomicrobium sp. SH664]|uniref:glycoside hydrolase family 88 protein n=1 Tax=Planctomicrobium sp. SH664 TaxID=3448125 RepID=UPI003F5B0847